MKRMKNSIISGILSLFLMAAMVLGTLQPMGIRTAAVEVYGLEEPTMAPIAYPEEDPNKFPGTTPPPADDIMLVPEMITDQMVDLATQRYNNFINAPLELFDWTDSGIIQSTGMASEAELEYVRNLAKEITKDCTTTDEKMFEIAKYLAMNICYDYDYINEKSPYPPMDPYTVLQNGYAVCAGYAKTYEALLQSIGIPCVYVLAPDHAWNAVYNGERWVLIDVTWMSKGQRNDGILNPSPIVSLSWYDFTLEKANGQLNHVIDELPLSFADKTLEKYPICSELSYIYWLDDIEIIDDRCFANFNGSFKDLVIPDGVKEIGYAAFYHVNKITGDLVLPDSLVTLDEFAFGGSGFNGTVTFGKNISVIDKYVFNFCEDLRGSLALPNSVSVIGEYAFYNCNGLTGSLNIPDSVASIGKAAFAFCTGLNGTLSIGSGITSICAETFYNCGGFTGVLGIPKNVTDIGEKAFAFCAKLTGSLDIPDKVTSIGKRAFYACTGFSDIESLGDKVTSIGEEAFAYCYGLNGTVEIPDSVKSIGKNAFYYCYKVNTAKFYGDVPETWGQSVFANMGSGFIIYYTEGNQSGWTTPTWTSSTMDVYNTRTFIAEQDTYTLTGKVTSYNPAVATTIQLMQEDEVKYTAIIEAENGTGQVTKEFTIENVEKGTYIMVITKDNHVTREYDVTIEDADVSVETKIHLLGDINGDGKITIIDYARANAHAKGVQKLTGYELQCADTVKQDGIITTADAARINAHAKGKSYMW